MTTPTRVQTQPRSSPHFRPDIQGLRALAVIPVVAFHAGWAFIPGGFVGVDVFFVISGFLITQHLLREIETRGSVNLFAFWARRLRRLSPALVTVVIASTLAGLILLSPLEWEQLAKDALASALYLSNMLFAASSTDYFADGQGQSALLHTWSLSVEEQFYIVWPLIVLAAALVARRRGVPVRRCIAVAFGAVLVVSLALSIYATASHPSLAFYVLPTRAWEFAAAGLLACIPERHFRFPAAARSAVGGLGLLILVASYLFIQASDPFPGILAAAPVVATLLVLAAGMGQAESGGMARKLLSNRPMQWVGARSYSWYLWHWPFIVFAAVAFDTESAVVKTAAAILSILAAGLSYRFVENIIRDRPALKKSPGRSFASAGGLIAVAALVAGGAFAASSVVLAQPAQAKFKLARDQVPTTSCAHAEATSNGDELCIFGNPAAERTVILAGDSHAGQWKAAFAQAARNADLRLIVRWKSSCPVNGLTVVSTSGAPVAGCADFAATTQRVAEDVQADAVVIAHANAYTDRIVGSDGEVLPEAEALRLWKQSYSRTIDELSGTGANVVAIADNPRFDFDPLACATKLGSSPDECLMDKSAAFAAIETLDAVDRSVWDEHGIREIFGAGTTVCADALCPVVDADGTPIYRDYNHLSEQWTTLQVPMIEEFLGRAVRS